MYESESNDGYSEDSDFDAQTTVFHRPANSNVNPTTVTTVTTATPDLVPAVLVKDEHIWTARRADDGRNGTVRRVSKAERPIVREETKDENESVDRGDGPRDSPMATTVLQTQRRIDHNRTNRDDIEDRKDHGGRVDRSTSNNSNPPTACNTAPTNTDTPSLQTTGSTNDDAEHTDHKILRPAHPHTPDEATAVAPHPALPPPQQRSQRRRRPAPPPRRLEELARPRSSRSAPQRRNDDGKRVDRTAVVGVRVRQFVERQERAERERRARRERREAELAYEGMPVADRKRCNRCRNVQSFEEVYGRRDTCPNCGGGDDGGEGGTYDTESKFHMERFERRLEEFRVQKETTIVTFLRQRLIDVRNSSVGSSGKTGNKKSRMQSQLMEKIAERQPNFLVRVGDDILARRSKIVDLERKVKDIEAKCCPFQPVISSLSSLQASKRSTVPLYLPKRYDKIGRKGEGCRGKMIATTRNCTGKNCKKKKSTKKKKKK